MKKQTIFYSVIGVAALIFAAGFLLSQYIKYKQYRLAQEEAIQDCIEKSVGADAAGFVAANAAQKCKNKFPK